MLILGGHADNRDIVVGVKPQYTGVNEMRTLRHAAGLSADDRRCASFMRGFQEGSKPRQQY